MNIRKNNYLVENALKNSVKSDRAKIQIGRISPFGLLEMSRQRLRPSLLELNFKICKNCEGTGFVRSIESQSLQFIRNLDLILKSPQKKEVNIELNPKLSEYLLNNKYDFLGGSGVTNNHIVKIKVDKTLEENKFSISVNTFEEEEKQESVLDVKPLHEKKEKINKKNSIKKKSIKAKENLGNDKTLKRKTKESVKKIKKTGENKSIKDDKKLVNKKTTKLKTKVKKKSVNKLKKEKVNKPKEKKVIDKTIQEVKKGWWKK